jgi:hypothetical protein
VQVVAVTKLLDGVTAGVSLMKQQVAEEEEEEEMGELAGKANHPSPVSVLDSATFEEELTHTPKCVKSSTISHEGKRSWMFSCYVFLTERKKVIVS